MQFPVSLPLQLCLYLACNVYRDIITYFLKLKVTWPWIHPFLGVIHHAYSNTLNGWTVNSSIGSCAVQSSTGWPLRGNKPVEVWQDTLCVNQHTTFEVHNFNDFRWNEPCALPLSPPKGGSNANFYVFALPFITSLQVIVDTSNLVRRLIIASPNLLMTNFPWNGRGHVTWSIHFKFQGPKHTSGITEARIVSYTCRLYVMLQKKQHITPTWAWLWFRDCFTIVPFAVMQRVARVRQRQLSYLCTLVGHVK